MPRRDDIPVAVEILDDEGNVIATEGGPALSVDVEPSERDRRRVSPRLLGALLALAAVIMVAVVVLTDDDTEPIEADPIGIMGGEDLVLGRLVDPATFPLFGQDWDFEALILDAAGREVQALDLNTGDIRTFGETGGTNRFVSGVSVVDGSVYMVSQREIIRVDPDENEVIVSLEEGFASGLTILGNYWFESTFFAGSVTVTHLGSGRETELSNITDFVIVGDDIFAARGGQIVRIDEAGDEHEWARGEILSAGRTGIAWRTCGGTDECEYWAGTADDSRVLRLSEEAAAGALTLGITGPLGGQGPFGSVDLLSPSLRYATTVELEVFDIGLPIILVDLQTGERVRVDGIDASPVFSPEERVLFVRRFGQLVAIDTRTGAVEQLPGPTGSPGFLDTVPFLPSN